MKLKIRKLTVDAVIPKYAHHGDAGMDLVASVELSIEPGETKLVKTGIAIELPEGYEAQVRPRSGMALKKSITVLNTPGTIDAGYRGEVGVILINHSKDVFNVSKGMKVAQMVISEFISAEIEEAEELTDTSRGEGGFGSTGTH